MTDPVVRPGPDPARDARVARRREAAAARAGRALDRLPGYGPGDVVYISDLIPLNHHCATCTCNNGE